VGTVNCSGKAMEPGPGAEEWYGWIGLGRACRLFVHGTEGGVWDETKKRGICYLVKDNFIVLLYYHWTPALMVHVLCFGIHGRPDPTLA
jgi:hypothetical protein